MRWEGLSGDTAATNRRPPPSSGTLGRHSRAQPWSTPSRVGEPCSGAACQHTGMASGGFYGQDVLMGASGRLGAYGHDVSLSGASRLVRSCTPAAKGCSPIPTRLRGCKRALAWHRALALGVCKQATWQGGGWRWGRYTCEEVGMEVRTGMAKAARISSGLMMSNRNHSIGAFNGSKEPHRRCRRCVVPSRAAPPPPAGASAVHAQRHRMAHACARACPALSKASNPCSYSLSAHHSTLLDMASAPAPAPHPTQPNPHVLCRPAMPPCWRSLRPRAWTTWCAATSATYCR